MCKYCEQGVVISPDNRDELGVSFHSAKAELVVYGLDKDGWDISVSCKIFFCPMCGRKLKREE